MMQHTIQQAIQEVLTTLGIEVPSIELTHPKDSSQGDYATNVAMIAAKKVGKNPRALAEEITSSLNSHFSTLNYVKSVEVAGPGFINFYLSQEYFLNELQTLLRENNKPLKTAYNGKKVMVEFTDPNPFKEFHIGHLYSNTVGESISRLIEAGGAEVKRANYQGDVGLHVAKAIYGMQEKLRNESLTLDLVASRSVGERAKWLGEAYALGASAYEEDTNAKEEIIEINKLIYSSSEGDGPSREVLESSSNPSNNIEIISVLYKSGRQWSLEYFELMYRRLGTEFAYFYFESKAGPIGLELVKEYVQKGIFQESEGAIVFKGEDHGLHTRVFINSLGLPTYEAKELGLAVTKYEEYPFDLSISITGNEINEYFKVLLKVLSLIKPEIAEKTRHISHGMVRLPEGKMSSRTGNVLTGEWLLDEAKQRLHTSYPDMTEETLEMVTVAAIKWALLRSGIGKDISFNIDESISFEGDSGPYIQYTYARTRSVLGKADMSNIQYLISNIKLEAEEIVLLKLLVRFDEVVTEAGEHFSPNIMTNYLFDVAQLFNHFYQKQRILNAEGEQREFRLSLTEATGQILKSGLHLLGIQTPEKM